MGVIHMNGGQGETSYANNSLPQQTVLLKTKPLVEEVVRQFCSTNVVKTMNIADLGCSTGPNAFLPATMILDAIRDCCSQLEHRMPDFKIFLNDLPESDFNTLFKTIPSFHETLKEDKYGKLGTCFVYGCPGSFYERLFPIESLHFVYSANSLHWLSKVPLALTGKCDLNKGNIALEKTSSSYVFDVYLKQFRSDFFMFLKSRSIEIVPGGHMVLSLMGRKTMDPFDEECYSFWGVLAHALRDMVEEGIVEEAKLESFNMPYYEPHLEELKKVIKEEGSFDIIQLESPYRESNFLANKSSNIINCNVLAKCTRAIVEPMLTNHFGPMMIDELFKRFEEKLLQGGIKKTVFLIVSLTRKG